MRELAEQNQKLLEELEQYKQVKTTDVWTGDRLFFAYQDTKVLTIFQQKLLLAQLTGAKKVPPLAAESPDTSFEYIPPKVRY